MNTKTCITATAFVLTVIVLATFASTAKAETSGWEFGVEAYLWGAGIDGRTTAGDKIDISFDNLISDLQLGFMGSVAASKDRWTLFADLVYLDVDDDETSTANIIGRPVKTKVDVELKGFISTLGAAYRIVETDNTRFNVLAGARYLWLDTDLKFEIGEGIRDKVSESGHVWDGIVGVRGATDLNERWYLTYYADVGTGDSDLTWQALAALNYRFSKFDAVLGYRYLDWDFDDNDTFDDLNISGPFAGVKFKF